MGNGRGEDLSVERLRSEELESSLMRGAMNMAVLMSS
jgi:hypothetical protein